MKIKKKIALLTLSSLTLLSSSLLAKDIEVTITNGTNAIYFTPLLVAAHPADAKLFTVGSQASTALQKMAEGGDTSALITNLNSVNATLSDNPNGGLLAPGASVTTTLSIDENVNSNLSVVAMMLPTNDGFVALNNAPIPTQAGTYKYAVNAYDAGTEANDEIINGGGAPNTPGIPASPDGNGGTGASGVTSSIEGYVHTHRGNLGDFDATSGKSDLDTRHHRWLNPVANITITVKN